MGEASAGKRADEPADQPVTEQPTEKAEEPKEKGGFLKFWTSLPGVLTGLAAVIAAVVSLVALFNHGSDAVAEPARPPAAQASDVPAQIPSAPVASSARAGGDVAGRGSLTLGVGEYADLTDGSVSDSVTANAHNPQFFLTASDGYRLVANSGRAFAPVDGTPDRAACVSAVSARQLGQVALTAAVQGRTVCVLTDTQQIAAVTLTTLPAVGSPKLTFDYVLWA